MNWQELTEKLYGLRRFGIEPGLESMERALDVEGHPERGYEIIIVAGTNGKGTVASLTAAMLQGNGLRVGLYTSPHLIDFRERFRINGRPIERDVAKPVLERLFATHAMGQASHSQGLTFFELSTLVAAVVFAQQKVDVAVFEVGLGGRLDAVNALEPAVTAVTTIGRDHTEYLGEELTEIAAEKAGIFRPGVPAIVGIQEYESAHRALVESGEAIGAEVIECKARQAAGTSVDIVARHRQTARRVVESLGDDSLTPQGFEKGLRNWRWPGRFDELALEGGPRLVVDAAHNAAGLSALQARLKERNRDIGAVIWASMKDKEPGDIQKLFHELHAPVWGSVVANERARSGEQLQRFVPNALWQGAAPTADVVDQIRQATQGDVLVFGSVFLVGELFRYLGRKPESLVTYRID